MLSGLCPQPLNRICILARLCHCAAADYSTPLVQCQEVMAFLKGQFRHDVIGPELSVGALFLLLRGVITGTA